MIYAVVLFASVFLVLLAKRGKRGGSRRRRRYLRGKILQDCDLGALATKSLVSCVSSEVASERLFVTSVDLSWALKDLIVVADDGPVIVGIAHSDYSAAEIEAVIENAGSWSEGDLIAQEIAKRKIRIVGQFEQTSAGAQGSQTFVLNEGQPIHTKLNWVLNTGAGLDFFAYNNGDDALTTGGALSIAGHANLWVA